MMVGGFSKGVDVSSGKNNTKQKQKQMQSDSKMRDERGDLLIQFPPSFAHVIGLTVPNDPAGIVLARMNESFSGLVPSPRTD